jgi:hypothetical protein
MEREGKGQGSQKEDRSEGVHLEVMPVDLGRHDGAAAHAVTSTTDCMHQPLQLIVREAVAHVPEPL